MADQPHYSDAALSVHITIRPDQLTDQYRGQRWAIQLPDSAGDFLGDEGEWLWYAATESEASAHGRRYGWERVAAIETEGEQR